MCASYLHGRTPVPLPRPKQAPNLNHRPAGLSSLARSVKCAAVGLALGALVVVAKGWRR